MRKVLPLPSCPARNQSAPQYRCQLPVDRYPCTGGTVSISVYRAHCFLLVIRYSTG
ncbi:hypothetical protein ETA_30220 [Erwinia tasmaniensis Et1/99]|uniref:Uncharacterized protein n=1 Tax=Erwinia tasmaniensis (strain DSM 17950 / CFBP 7177 / CIP 109463 / NCPPB 4357 / Et1/99) TaxID=465817 RepID=B2VCQ2_ERWT9|nr:hypothetical protein ETA_30220 [Erwinia tasmaniensis Et1/99]